ncbi:Glutathione S-transferase class-mu 28 kDa isozyme (GST 28) (Sj28 antigen) (Sj28GST) (Fragment) [Durusdinium trenchii]|uniref:Glutathione S-transferase class-mu 28 kDa isozyme (GST 28) (Sj28 antigen) (Sj28GST) n=1 Tax=Durusdinium trenchii TaxID=1381693 RepID=A0ABP0Q726_9DINO
MTGTDFEDKRIEFKDWATLKPTTPHGQLPMMTLTQPDGTETKFAQSVAMMRWVARKFDSSNTLYPADADAMLEIEELIGLSEDMDWPQKHATVKKWLREEFLKDSLPKFMEFFTKKLEKTGTFFCGDQPTIADLQILAQLRYFTKGVADHVPADCLKPFPASWKNVDAQRLLGPDRAS